MGRLHVQSAFEGDSWREGSPEVCAGKSSLKQYCLSMVAALEKSQPVPLVQHPSGTLVLAGTRVPLDIVAEAFYRGASAEEIVEQYPALNLPDLYSVLAYVLRHEAEIAEYLKERAVHKAALREDIEQRFPPKGIRERLGRRQRNQAAAQ
jgi:uncharacterized protein (DUF433 family)